jgi:hypothetical protein
MSAQVTITQLPAAGTLTGNETVPIVQNGQTVRTTTGAISSAGTLTQSFLTVTTEPSLVNSRALTNGTGIGLTNTGSTLQINLNGASGSLEGAGTGFVVKNSGTTVVARNIAASGNGISISNGDGQSGNPTVSLTGNVLALAGVSANGLLTITTAGAVGATSIAGTANQTTVTNGDAVAGAPTVGLANNPVLPGVASVTLPIGATSDRPTIPVNGMVRYNSTTAGFEGYSGGAWGPIGGGGTVSSITAGTGLSGGTITTSGTISIASTGVTAGSYTNPSITVNAQGQLTSVASGTAPVTSITGTTNAISVSGTTAVTINLSPSLEFSGKTITNGSYTGATINSSTIGASSPAAGTFTTLATTTGTVATAPVGNNDIANKFYVDSVATGLHFHASCDLATTTALPTCTYSNGASGVGATLTATANAALTVDSTATVVGYRILVKNQASGLQNGIYTVTQVGSASLPFILTRATDYNTGGTGANQVNSGDYTFITGGSTLVNSSWVQTTAQPITIGTTALAFAQFSTSYTYSAGTGLSLASNTFSITNTGVSAATYGSASQVPVVAINAQGQVTSASNTSIAISGSQITSGQVAIAQGGTGQATASAAFNALSPITTTGDIILGNGTNSATRLGIGASGYVLTSNGTTASWAASSGGVTSFQTSLSGLTPSSSTTGAITLAGTLGATSGGTSQSSYTTGDLLYASATNTLSKLPIGTNGYVLTSNGSTVSWAAGGGGSPNLDGGIPSSNYGGITAINGGSP